MPPAATTPLESKICTRFVQFWAMAQLIDFVVGNATGGGTWEHLQLAAVLVAGMLPNRSVPVVVAFALRAACVAVRAPWAWDGEFLTACTEVAFVAHVLLGGPDGVAAMGETIRSQMAIFYWFAGFWKVNTAFLNPKYSCGSVYFVQLLDAYVPESLLTQELVSFAVNVAPAATIVLECSIGVAMAFACWKPFSRSSTNATSTWGKLGVILGSMLHFGIALTPKPNNIALFGVMVAVRYFWFAPAGSASAIDEVLRSPLRVGAVHVLAAATLVGATLACQEGSDALTEVQDGRRPLSSLDRPMFAWSILTTLLLRGIMLDGTVNGASSQDCSMSASSRWTHRTVSVVGFTVVLFWTLGPLLGLQDIGCVLLVVWPLHHLRSLTGWLGSDLLLVQYTEYVLQSTATRWFQSLRAPDVCATVRVPRRPFVSLLRRGYSH
jgi:hypothetical protein